MEGSVGTTEPVAVAQVEPPPRSLTERFTRWIGGADRREAQAEAQAQAAQERAAALARSEVEAAAQAERDRLAEQVRAEAAALAQAQAQAESVRVAVESTEPLIQVQTPSGGTYQVRTADWLAARASGGADVPTCDWRGQPVVKGERTTLRLSTIEAAMLRPIRIIAVAEYQPPVQEQEGPSLSV